jgi:phage terminase large subunit-like protein
MSATKAPLTDLELRQRALEQFELQCPQVACNPYVVHWPHLKQAQLLGAHLHAWDPRDKRPFECLYGGAAGGGKSDALLMAAAQYAWKHPQFSGLLLRRSHAELAKPGALMDRAMRWWVPLGVHWDGQNKLFTFPNGARVQMGYHGHPRDSLQYQGNEYHFVGFDELTHWPDDRAYDEVRSRIRKAVNDPVPLRLLSTSNPGGPGHDWVKRRFVGGIDPGTGLFVSPPHHYIPATIRDNPSLDGESYLALLADMHPTRREQLMNGDWSAREPGDYFRVEWFGPMLEPEVDELPRGQFVAVRWWDLAASEDKNAARTAGVLQARCLMGVRAILHCNSFRATPGKRDAMIVQQAHADGRHVVVGIEIEGGSGGPAQFEALATRLRAEGFRVVGARPRPGGRELTEQEKTRLTRTPVADKGKESRADPVASCLERGYQRRGECPENGAPWWGLDRDALWSNGRDGIRIFAGPWTQDYLDVLEGFPGAARKDEVDATAGGWGWLEAHAFGQRVAPEVHNEHDFAEPQNVHPQDRTRDDDDLAGDRDSGGRWRA